MAVLALLLLLGGCHSAVAQRASPDPIDVFVLPHAHCDVGWLKTVDGYFDDQVTHILTTITDALTADKRRRFIWSEIKWLEMWWPNKTEATRAKFRDIVQSGQLEFAGAGWSQNDEVTPMYTDIVDNQFTGHEYLRKIGLQDVCPQPGRCVRFGWQIDMFAGFSGATPSLWALSGYDGMFSRWEGTAEQRDVFVRDKAFEFLWDASEYLPANRSRIWTHIINGNYGDLDGFRCGQNDTGHSWQKPDVPCTPANENITGFSWPGSPVVTDANVEAYAELFAAFVRWRHVYRGPQLAVWGSDYAFTDAGAMFASMDKIVDHVNANPSKYGLNVRYTTLAQYADHLHSVDVAFPVKGYPLDFEKGWPHQWNLSLANNFTTQYQTGAATSRAELKQTARAVAAAHRGAEAALSLATMSGTVSPSAAAAAEAGLYPAWDALGIIQHHDALTGTMSTQGSFPWGGDVDAKCVAGDTKACPPCNETKCRVLEDYMERLRRADASSEAAQLASAEALAGAAPGSLRAAQDGASSQVVVFNTLSEARRTLVTATLPSALVPPPRAGGEMETGGRAAGAAAAGALPVVLDSRGEAVQAQLDAAGRAVSWVADLGGFGWHTFRFVSRSPAPTTSWPRPARPPPSGACLGMSNGVVGVACDAGGRIASLTRGGVRVRMEQDHMAYHTRHGGPYCLVEEGEAQPLEGGDGGVEVTHMDGPLFSEVTVSRAWGDGAFYGKRGGGGVSSSSSSGGGGSSSGGGEPRLSVTARVTRGTTDDAVLRLRHDIPVIPVNHELIHRVRTDLANEGLLHDDSGFELYPSGADEELPISGRYHAAVLSAVIREPAPDGRQLSFLTAHTKGVASLRKGELEYMMIRRINGTDDQGPWPLNETTPLSLTVGLLAGAARDVEPERIGLARSLDSPPAVMYVSSSAHAPARPAGAPVASLPRGVAVLSLYNAPKGLVSAPAGAPPAVVVRLQNIGGESDASVNLTAAFRMPVAECTEMTLTLQQRRSDSVRMQWKAEPAQAAVAATPTGFGRAGGEDCGQRVSISPLDIRTFVLRF